MRIEGISLDFNPIALIEGPTLFCCIWPIAPFTWLLQIVNLSSSYTRIILKPVGIFLTGIPYKGGEGTVFGRLVIVRRIGEGGYISDSACSSVGLHSLCHSGEGHEMAGVTNSRHWGLKASNWHTKLAGRGGEFTDFFAFRLQMVYCDILHLASGQSLGSIGPRGA